MSTAQILEEIVEIGVPLAKAAWGMISEAFTASKERREQIRARLAAAKAALLPASEEAHRVHDEELAATKAAILDEAPVALPDQMGTLVADATKPVTE